MHDNIISTCLPNYKRTFTHSIIVFFGVTDIESYKKEHHHDPYIFAQNWKRCNERHFKKKELYKRVREVTCLLKSRPDFCNTRAMMW